MRVVALFLTMLAVSTVVSSAQCVVRCSEPPHHPPCHHQIPSKQSPATQPPCDSLMVAGETPYSRLAISGLPCGLTAWMQALPATPFLPPGAPSRIGGGNPANGRLDSPLADGVVVLRL